MRIKPLAISILTAFSFLLSACADKPEEKKTASNEVHANHSEHSASGDIQEETKGLGTMPSFLSDKPEDMQLIYSAAAKNRKLLENIPCYCGCGESANHKNNYDCFINENKENGAIVWDDHGTKCGVCLEIAAQSVLQLQEGKSIKEIRSEIDEKYKEGYAKPTPTPEV
ncbi:PCYCGC motif-containing (lipo)protein [Metabacillus dongyingensis]|uniref:PCYCGC motif-containing (lipo)protein n=1 Tax=Metabacillus dongyingensis TaxID=2874282 RepID=UPI003B8E94DB